MRYDPLPKTIVLLIAVLLIASFAASAEPVLPTDTQVLFVCEHGNVKSLMAASYFNQLAKERGLSYRAISRGVAPDSTAVPPAIIAGLRAEGIDVATFHPVAVDTADISASRRVILINTALPENLQVVVAGTEQWTDVPPATTDYAAASAVLRSHVEQLIEEMHESVTR